MNPETTQQRPPEWATECEKSIQRHLDDIGHSMDGEIAAIIAKHAPRETANARLVRAAKDALTIIEPLRFNGVPLTQLIEELRTTLAATEAQPEIGEEVLEALEKLKSAITEVLLPKLNEKGATSMWLPEEMQWTEAVAKTDAVLQKFGRGK